MKSITLRLMTGTGDNPGDANVNTVSCDVKFDDHAAAVAFHAALAKLCEDASGKVLKQGQFVDRPSMFQKLLPKMAAS